MTAATGVCCLMGPVCAAAWGPLACGPSSSLERQSYAERTRVIACAERRKVDLLVVVDDSVSMGPFRQLWSTNLPAYIDALETEDLKMDYRVAFTSSSVTGPGCASGNDGRLLLHSCLEDPNALVSGPDLDGAAVDLTSICATSCDAPALVTAPTRSSGGTSEPRPWLQRILGVANVEIATSMAMTCAGQLPVGCPYEQPLEAMKMAIDRMYDVEDPAYGFMRDDAVFMVLFVTDEDDCSIQDADAFFSVASESPSSACWHAGATCSPTEDGSLDCVPAAQGMGGPLHDLDRYFDVLDRIEEQKQRTNPDQEVVVSVIGGVPRGYSSGNANLHYQPPSEFDGRDVGVGPGCSLDVDGVEVEAYPPLRLRELAARYNTADDPNSQRNLYSACSHDYRHALEPVAQWHPLGIPAHCFQSCVADVDDDVPGLQPECRVFEDDGRRRKELPPCEAGELPEGEVACFILKTGEDMAQECIDDGWNLELEVVRDPARPPDHDVCMEVTCAISTQADQDCPDDAA